MSGGTTLGEIAELQTGFPFKSAEFSTDPSAVRLLRGDNIAQARIRWTNAARWSAGGIDQRYELREGDVVVAMDRPWIEAGLKYASISQSDLPSFLVQRVARLRAKAGTNQRYLHYVIGSADFTRHVLSQQTGTGIPHISGSQILSFRLPDRSPSEQQAIAEVLGALDDKIAANGSVIAATERLMLSLAGTAVSQATVAELATQSTQAISPASFDTSVAHFSLPAFDAGAVPEQVDGIQIKSNKFLLAEPSVLVSKLNPRIPRSWNVSALPAAMSLASTEFVVLAPSGISTSALWAALSRPEVAAELATHVAGTSGSHQRIKPATVLQLTVPDPRSLAPDSLATVDALGETTHAYREESQLLSSTRDELLPLLMSGNVRVRDAEKTVEAVV